MEVRCFSDFYNLKGDLQYSDPDFIKSNQLQRLKNHLMYCYKNSPFYRSLWNRKGLDPDKVSSYADFLAYPLTEKGDLNHRNNEFLAVEPHDIRDVCLTSSSTGSRPTSLLQTQSDLGRLAYNEEQAFAMGGIGPGDRVLVAAALGRCFMAGLAYFMGSASLGCQTIRSGSGNAAQTWELIKQTRPTVIVGVPSLMRRIAEHAISIGEEPSMMGVKKLVGIGEPVRDSSLELLTVSQALERIWNAEIFSTYASTELATTFMECSARKGGHVRPEMIFVEILDDSGSPVKAGEKGEVVVTPLGVTGMPLVRFRTGDISYLIDEPCTCGRTTMRIAPILGRKNQMLKYKGTTLFPNTFLQAIEGIPSVQEGYIEVSTGPDGNDRISLVLSMENPEKNLEDVKEIIRAKARVLPDIIIGDRAEIEEKIYGTGKRKRVQFYDLRTEK